MEIWVIRLNSISTVIHYFEAKNIDWRDESQSKRIIAMMTANFKGNAAAWYMLSKNSIKDVQDGGPLENLW